MGFHKVYLAIIIGAFGINGPKISFLERGIDVDTFHKVYNFPYREYLDDEVEVIFIEIIQPLDNSINLTGVINICLEKPSVEREQDLFRLIILI